MNIVKEDSRNFLVFPVKSRSERVTNKNFVKIGGRPLYQIFPTTCREADVFDEIAIDTDSEEIKDWCYKEGFRFIKRVPRMTMDDFNGNMLLRHHVTLYSPFDTMWQGFVTSPCISVESVRRMFLQLVKEGGSIMSVKEHKGFFWNSMGLPISYRHDVMPRSQDVPPIYEEICGLFGITSKEFLITNNRAGTDPMFFPLPREETVDIDWVSDIPKESPAKSSRAD